MTWRLSWRADPVARLVADRHYNRQAVGAAQFVPPGACVVLRSEQARAVWVTSWPRPEYVMHQWRGLWVNTLFRREEGGGRASEMIRAAVAATRALWAPPPGGLITFVDSREVPGVMVRGERIYGFCYLKAGFEHVGFTATEELWAWQLRPERMPTAAPPLGMQLRLAV